MHKQKEKRYFKVHFYVCTKSELFIYQFTMRNLAEFRHKNLDKIKKHESIKVQNMREIQSSNCGLLLYSEKGFDKIKKH